MALNEDQEKIAAHREGRAIGLAGPGSGKTATVTERTRRLIAEGVDPANILMITFTNKARDEMKERLLAKVGEAGNKVFISNFHGLCGQVLRRFGAPIGYTDRMTICDTDDQENLIKQIARKKYADKGVDEKDITKMLNVGKVRAIARQANDMRETLQPMSFLDDAVDAGKIDDTEAWIVREYLKLLKARNQCDFTGMLSETVALLRQEEEVRARLQKKFQWLQVDEYQDTNGAQNELIELIAGDRDNVLAIGDVDQCVTPETLVSTPSGLVKASEVQKGQMLLSGQGGGRVAASRVNEVAVRRVTDYPMARITVKAAGQSHVLECTAEHKVFAGYDLHLSPNLEVVYLMYRPDMGFRVGTTRVRFTRKDKSALEFGFAMRAKMEKATRVWVLNAYADRADAAEEEQYINCTYGIPTWTFEPPSGGKSTEVRFKRLFERVKTEEAGRRLLTVSGHRFEMPTYCRAGHAGNALPPTVTITLASDSRGTKPYHRLSSSDLSYFEGEAFEYAVRRGQKHRLDHHSASLKDLRVLAGMAAARYDAVVQEWASLGGVESPSSLPYTLAGAVSPGMIVYVENNGHVVPGTVEKIEAFQYTGDVYDFEVDKTHNFIASKVLVSNSIYGWRGAGGHAAIERFINKGRGKNGCEVYKLGINYRSTPEIIHHASKLIECSTKRESIEFKASKPSGDPVRSKWFNTPEEEANAVCEGIKQSISKGEPAKEICVLYRLNDMSRLVEQGLAQRGIPYKMVGGGSFYDRMEVKDCLSFLRFLCNPKDTISFHRVANKPTRGMGDVTIGMLETFAEEKGINLIQALGQGEQIQIMTDDAKSGQRKLKGLTDAGVAGCKVLYNVFGFDQRGKSVYDCICHMLNVSNYEKWLEETYLKKSREEVEERRRNLNELVNSISKYSDENPKATLGDYLQSISLYTEGDDEESENGVRLMSMHASKGMEFNAVYIIGAENGMCPHKRAVQERPDGEGLDEERRLFYVAMTRARNVLRITHCLRRQENRGRGGKWTTCQPSVFLVESGVLGIEDAQKIMRTASLVM